MNFFLKIFLFAVAIGVINIGLYFFLLQFQIVRNSGYVPQELVVVVLILIAIPIQFLILVLVGHFTDRSELAIRITLGFFVFICFLLLWFDSLEERATYNNEQVYNATEKYDYEQGISTPEGYPIKLLSESQFKVAVKGDRNPVTLLETGKVYSGICGVGDNTFKSSDEGGIVLPDSLKLYWYAYVEDKYYGLKTKLDKDKISEYFKMGYVRDFQGHLNEADFIKGDYRDLVAGIAPGGDVVLWISGGFETTRELAVFKAKEMSAADFKDYDTINDVARKEVLADTCTCEDRPQFRRIVNNSKPIPAGKWMNKYRQKFDWKFTINNFGQTKTKLILYCYNGERFAFYNEEISKLPYQKQVLPSTLTFAFIKNEKRYHLAMDFNEEEVYHHFAELSKMNQPIELSVNISEDLTQTTVQLIAGKQKLNFEKLNDVKIYKD